MSSLKSLTLTTLPKAENSPFLLRWSRLIEKLEDQKSLLKDPAYVRVVQRWKKQDGERVLVERRLPVRPWWRTDEKGQVVFFVRLGWKPIEFERGKAGIVAGSTEKLPEVIDVLIGLSGPASWIRCSIGRERLAQRRRERRRDHRFEGHPNVGGSVGAKK